MAEFERKTRETDIKAKIDLYGQGMAKISCEAKFFSHMLEAFAKTALIDLELDASGDFAADDHHIVEDAGICIGECLKKALGAKEGINRYGYALAPMDDALAQACVDLSGRPFLVFREKFAREKVGDFSTELVKEFLYALSYSCGCNIQVRLLEGENDHHKIEALFKALGLALRSAMEKNARIKGALSTKGVL